MEISFRSRSLFVHLFLFCAVPARHIPLYTRVENIHMFIKKINRHHEFILRSLNGITLRKKIIFRSRWNVHSNGRLISLVFFSVPLISPLNDTNGNNNATATPKPVHLKKEEEAKKGKPYSLHCVVAPSGGNPVIEWRADKNEIKIGKVHYSLHWVVAGILSSDAVPIRME